MQKSQSTFPSDGAQVQHFVLLHFLLDLHISFFFFTRFIQFSMSVYLYSQSLAFSATLAPYPLKYREWNFQS